MEVPGSLWGRCHGSRGFGQGQGKPFQCLESKTSQETQGQAYAISLVAVVLPAADPQATSRLRSGSRDVSPHFLVWFPAPLASRTCRLSNPGRRALAAPGLPRVKTAQCRITGQSFHIQGLATCYYEGLALGAWPHSPTLQDAANGGKEGGAERGWGEMQSPKV